MIIDSFPLLIILISYLTAFSTMLLNKKRPVKTASLFSSLMVLFLSFLVMNRTIMNGAFTYNAGHFDSPWGVELYIGNIEAVIGFVISFVFCSITWHSLYSIDEEVDESRVKLYYFLCNILIGSVMGVVFTNDIFNAFVFIEVGTIASCGIIVVKNKKENFLATLKYLVLSSLGSGLFLMGTSFLYSITGNLNLSYINREISIVYMDYPNVILIATALFTVGLGIKSAMFPLHTWLPDGHSSAPTTSSALLSSIVLKAFVLLYIKILYRGIGVDMIAIESVFRILMVLGSAGMIIGSFLAIAQRELKRMIAYSTVAQMGYIFYGIGLGTKAGIAFAVYHIIAHAFAKSILFLSAGDMISKNKSKYISDLNGIGKKAPISLAAFTVASLSMIGIPLFPGFISKWNLSLATIEQGDYIFLGAVILSSLLNAVYYLPIIINGYFLKSDKESDDLVRPLIVKRYIPIFLLVLGMIYSGLASDKIIGVLNIALR